MSTHILNAQIPQSCMGQRLDVAISPLFPDYSRSRIQQWIKDGNLKVDGEVWNKPRQAVLGGEKVELIAELEEEVSLEAQDIPLDIVYEDDAILVINKPAGLVVHPGAGIVHRLDKETSGLMVVAKTVPAQTHLVDQLQRHAVERIYDAVVVGHMISGGTVDKPIGRSPQDRKKMAIRLMGGKHAVSHYRVLEHFREHTRIRVKLETGRTHQIRVHMASIGFPLMGDPVYGKRMRIPKQMLEDFIETLRNFKRQALHAGALSLTHPVTGKTMKWKVDMPEDMLDLIDTLRDDMEEFESKHVGYDEFDYDYGVEVEWVTDDDIPD